MSVADLIEKLQAQKTEAVTVRLPSSELGTIDDLSASLGVTRQRLLTEVIKDGIAQAVKLFNEKQKKIDEELEDDENNSPRFFILNTNKANDVDTHEMMLEDGVAAAFCDPWKSKIERLKRGDTVFLYESGAGIVATGIASGNIEKVAYEGQPENAYQQKLDHYRKVKPLSAREIKKVFGSNLVFLQTMFKIPAVLGAKLEKHLENV